jgi:hypothetical protein
MAKIPKALHGSINTAYPKNVCLVGTVQPDGWAQVTPRGSLLVWDDETLAYWDRGRGKTFEAVRDGSKVMVFFRSPELREKGVLPKGGIARFYGTASVYPSGPLRDQVYDRIIPPEQKADSEKRGRAVLVKVERAEDLGGAPLE